MGIWVPGIALLACFSQADKKLLTIGNNLHFLTSFNPISKCILQVKCFTANLRVPLRADLLMTMHQDPSDFPVKITYVPILQLGAKSNLTVMALRNELDVKISLRKGFSL